MSNSGELDSFQNAASPKRKPRSAKTEIDPEIRRWFESEFWPLYPRHEGKKPALLAAAKEATTPQKRTFCLERLKAQLPAYLQRKARSGQSTIPLASTWFNQERADDELQLDPEPGRRLPVSDDYPEYVHPTEKTNLQ